MCGELLVRILCSSNGDPGDHVVDLHDSSQAPRTSELPNRENINLHLGTIQDPQLLLCRANKLCSSTIIDWAKLYEYMNII